CDLCMRRFFFFQAEDGIRYWSVTGVQTCALPIFNLASARSIQAKRRVNFSLVWRSVPSGSASRWRARLTTANKRSPASAPASFEIGRASCRERVWIAVGGVALMNKTDEGATRVQT